MKSKLFPQCKQRIHPVLNIYYQHPNNSKQHGALAKIGNMQAGLETFNQQPCSPGSCHSVGLAKALPFVKAAPVLAKKVTAAISFSGP